MFKIASGDDAIKREAAQFLVDHVRRVEEVIISSSFVHDSRQIDFSKSNAP
jgi:hypothetical protein